MKNHLPQKLTESNDLHPTCQVDGVRFTYAQVCEDGINTNLLNI